MANTSLPVVSLLGQVVLVTGAATGIGRAIALRMAQAGAAVAVNHLPGSAQAALAQDVVRSIADAGGRAVALAADVSDTAQVDALVVQTRAQLGPIDVLVNCAGVIQEKPFLDTTDADWERMIAIDLGSVFRTCRAVLPEMVARSRGVIINIASDLGLVGRADYAPYCAAKAGVLGLTKSLAREFAPAIRVNAIAPGPVDTAMLSPEHMSAQWLARELAIPQARFAHANEIADTALFLASDWSRFYCGQVLGPNGGSVMP